MKQDTSWENVADWYNAWAGKGSKYHKEIAIPSVVKLLNPKHGEVIVDFGCGTGILAEDVVSRGAKYIGVDPSKTMISNARKSQPKEAEFVEAKIEDFRQSSKVNSVVFMFSIQDMKNLDVAYSKAAEVLRDGGKLVVFMLHPAFRIPRMSGWGFDNNRKSIFRRIDRYMNQTPVPLTGEHGNTTFFHRPLNEYLNKLQKHGLVLDRFFEISDSFEDNDKQEFPRFLAIRALKV